MTYKKLVQEGRLEELLGRTQMKVSLLIVDIHEDHIKLVVTLYLVVKNILVCISNY